MCWPLAYPRSTPFTSWGTTNGPVASADLGTRFRRRKTNGYGNQAPRSVPSRGDGTGGQPVPQLQCCPVVAAVHGERALPHPGTGREPDPGVQESRTGAGESKTPRAHTERVRGAQRWIVPGEGLVEVDDHRLRRGDLPVGRSAGERLVPLHVIRTHDRILRSQYGGVLSSYR